MDSNGAITAMLIASKIRFHVANNIWKYGVFSNYICIYTSVEFHCEYPPEQHQRLLELSEMGTLLPRV